MKTAMYSSKLNIFLVLFILFPSTPYATHIKGTFRTQDFFKFLIKFGFQKTDRHQREATHGYIFGNITAEINSHYSNKGNVPALVTFAVLDRSDFLDYYRNRVFYDKDEACRRMFSRLDKKAFDWRCSPNGSDYLRRVPCPKGELCIDEDTSWHVVKNSQFTYVIQDLKQASFWYISVVACYRNQTTCTWHHTPTSPAQAPPIINYNFHLVNGNPNSSSFSALTYQFSYDRQNTLEMHLLFWLCYMVLVPLQLHVVRVQRHPVTKLFTGSLVLNFIGSCLGVVHVLKYSMDGGGFPKLERAGDVFNILSRTTFMLLLLLLAKGWAVTRLELTWKPLVFAIWLCYGIVNILLYVWNLTEVDIIEDIDEYQTWPGWLIIVFRSLIMIWFLYELRTTMLYEHNQQKLNFLLHFGASSLVWFIYLVILAVISLHVSTLWRYKLILGITYSADCFAYCVMAHLLWPTRAEQYFLLAGSSSHRELDELDEFNEAPHVVHASHTSLLSNNSTGSTVDVATFNDNTELSPSVHIERQQHTEGGGVVVTRQQRGGEVYSNGGGIYARGAYLVDDERNEDDVLFDIMDDRDADAKGEKRNLDV